MDAKCILSTAAIFIVLSSCVNKNVHMDAIECVEFNPLEIASEVSDMNNYIESVDCITLDTKDFVFDLNTKKMLVLEDGSFVILTDSGMLKFDKSGEYLFSFGDRGRGPGEFIKVYDICLSSNKTELWALNSVNQLLKYDINTGKFIELIDTKAMESGLPGANALMPSGDEGGFYLYCANEKNPSHYDKDFFCLIEFNKKGKLVNRLLPWKDFNIDYPYSPMISYNYDNSYIIRPQENDNICYQVKDGKISKLCKIHFGKDNIEPHFAFKDVASPWDKLGEVMPSNSYKTPMCIQQTEKYLFFSAVGPQAIQDNFLIDLKTLKGIHWIHHDTASMPLFVVGSDANSFYAIFNNHTTNTDAEVEKLDPMLKYLIRDVGLHLDDDDNPIVVKIRFK